jgi:hypothetical protein
VLEVVSSTVVLVGGSVVTTILRLVPALDFVTLCASEVPDSVLVTGIVPALAFEVIESVLVAGTVPALAFEVLDATLSVEVAPADTPVGSAP